MLIKIYTATYDIFLRIADARNVNYSYLLSAPVGDVVANIIILFTIKDTSAWYY